MPDFYLGRFATLAVLLAAVAHVEVTDAEEPRAKHLLIIGIDGCRPDALDAADTPNLDALAASGVRATNTDIRGPRETAADTVSGPGWSNLLTGVWPDKHGALDNDFKGTRYDQFPHFFQRLKTAMPTAATASFTAWKPIDEKILTAADDHADFEQKDHSAADAQVAERAVKTLTEGNPTCIVVYFGQVDIAGHGFGFHPSVPEYVQAIETVDRHVGEVLAAVAARKTFADEDWLTIVCTDHGGRGRVHGGGKDSAEVRRVFLIVSGAAAERGTIERQTYQVDVVPTVLAYLGIAIDDAWQLDGKPVGLRGADARR